MSLQTLNENLDIIQNLVIPFLEDDLDNIQKLDDEPNDVGGLTAAELKAEFDKAGNTIKEYLNETLIPQLSDTVAEAEARATAERERVANENIRVANENVRIENEDARQENETARVQAENDRADAESARKTAETQRAAAESTRQSQEQARETAEAKRATAETTRQIQETTRQNQEQGRQNQEQSRQTAESARATEESTRQSQEATRQGNETTRQSQEATRQSNEQARKTAEAQREANEQSRKNSFDEEIKQAKSWAVGGTGVRDGEDTNNAKYWSEQAKANVGGDFATNSRVDEVEDEVGRVAQSVTTLETKVEQDVGQAVQEVNQTISGLQTRVQPINLGGTGATTAAQALANLGGIAAGAVGNLHVWERVQSGVTDYLTSTDRNAYTDGTVDNTTITYLGQLGDKVRIKVGSYVGTGTATTVINLGFTPAIVWVQRAGMTGGYTAYDGYGAIALTGASVATSDVTRLKIVDGGFQVTQADSATNSKNSDLNRSGESYVYIAVP